MRCPFLSETDVRYCGAFPVRKLLLNTSRPAENEKCTSRRCVSCKLLAERPEASLDADECPFLRRSLVQYCSVAPDTHLIPYSEGLLSCCPSGGHRYCELFLSHAQPESAAGRQVEGPPAGTTRQVNGIDVPLDLAFAANHMWLDISEDGACDLGADDFLAKVVGGVESVSFVSRESVCQPTAVLRVYGVDLTLTFPERVYVSRSNVHLRRDPERLTSYPYGRGWLFEGRMAGAGSRLGASCAGLRRGDEALAWMRSETERMTSFVHEIVSQVGPDGQRLLNDGGTFSAPIVPHLAVEDRLLLINGFFTLDSKQGPT